MTYPDLKTRFNRPRSKVDPQDRAEFPARGFPSAAPLTGPPSADQPAKP